jgi:hypothetical protein
MKYWNAMSRIKRSDLGRRGLLPRPAELLAYGLHLGYEGKEAALFVRPDASAPPATINDWKTEAMEKGLLEPPAWPEGILAPEVALTIREKYHHEPWLKLEGKLRKASGGRFHQIWVFPDVSVSIFTRQRQLRFLAQLTSGNATGAFEYEARIGPARREAIFSCH